MRRVSTATVTTAPRPARSLAAGASIDGVGNYAKRVLADTEQCCAGSARRSLVLLTLSNTGSCK